MGMFNMIFADLMCPVKQEIAQNSEIQIKWQERQFRQIVVYHAGDTLEGIENEYDNTWVRTDYICNVCSKKTVGRNKMEYIKTMDQSRHPVFVRIEKGKICRIISEAEFNKTGASDFVDYQ